jgi:hypothetical protein
LIPGGSVLGKPCCRACRRRFVPCPKVKDQRYCSADKCQKVRKRRWQAKKKKDAAYRENQLDAHKRWKESHPDYWRDYRNRHPEYVLRNKERQRERTRLKRNGWGAIVKMDAITGQPSIIPGHYELFRVARGAVAKMDAIHVEIRPIPRC